MQISLHPDERKFSMSGISLSKEERTVEYLRGTAIFGSLGEDDLRTIAAKTYCKEIRAGEVLVKEGDAANEAFCVLYGELEVFRKDLEGLDVVIGKVRPGEILGEMLLFNRQHRSASVRAVSNVMLMVMSAQDLKELVDIHPAVLQAISRLLAGRLTAMGEAAQVEKGKTEIPISLNLSVRGIGTSATLAINEHSRRLEAAGRRIYRFGLGQSPFPIPGPVVDRLKQAAAEKDYLAVEGLPALREAVADFHRRNDGAEIGGDDVLVGPGSKELMFLLQLSYYGDLIIPTPCWVSYGPQARIIGRKVKLLHTSFDEKWRLSPHRFRELCQGDKLRPRILILNYPGNPEGGTYEESELMEIARVAREHGVILLSDEIYGPLHYTGQHRSIARYYPEGTIISGGLSKWCGAGGWRLGTFAFPPKLDWLRKAISAVASETYTAVSAPVQFAAVSAYRGSPEIDQYLVQARRILRALGYYAVKNLQETGVRLHPPTGGFYLMLDFSLMRGALKAHGITDSLRLCSRILDEANVALLAGVHFERPVEELTARLAFVDFDGKAAMDAANKIPLDEELGEEFISTQCDGVYQGVKALLNWINSCKQH